jgi:hypothetical protein
LARRFQIPEGTRRHFSLTLSVLVLLAGAGYAYYRTMPPTRPSIAAEAVQQFRNTCVKEARHANGGGDLVMDDATEARIGGYCGCVADGLVAKVPPEQMAKIADSDVDDDMVKLLDAIVAGCQAKLQ